MEALTPRDLWKRSAIGASELAAIFGSPSPWLSASDVWLDRMGLALPKEETPAMVAGRALERPVLKLGADALGIPLTHNRRVIPHPDYPRVPLFATPDGFAPGRRAVAECKLVGHRFADWRDGPPGYVRVQVAGQLACVPRADEGIVIALVGSELRTYRLPREPEVERALIARVVDWWQTHIVGEISPEPDTPDAAWRLFGATAELGDERKGERIALPDEQTIGTELLQVARAIQDLEARQDELRRELAERTTDSDLLGVGWRAGWMQRSSTSWRSVALEAGAPDEIIAAHTKRSPSFTFRALGQPA